MVISLSLGGLSAPRMLVSRLLLTDVSHPLLRFSSGEGQPIRLCQRYLVSARRSDHDQVDRTEALEGWADPSGERIDGRPIYRRAVTRRASWTFVPAPACLKQGVVKSGQTCAEQSSEAARISSRSALARATSSSACTFGANAGNAATAAPRTTKIARDDRDLAILFS